MQDEEIYLQLPLGTDIINFNLIKVSSNRFLLKNKEDMEPLCRNLMSFKTKHKKLTQTEYKSYCEDRVKNTGDEFSIDNNPFSQKVNPIKGSLFSTNKNHKKHLICSNFANNPNLVENTSNLVIKTIKDPTGAFILYKGETLNGLKHGKGIEFYPNGSPKYAGKYYNDLQEDTDCTFFNENGTKMYTGGVSNSMLSGFGKLFHESGVIGYNGTFKDNSPYGDQVTFYDRFGNVNYQGGFKNGQKEGQGKEYYYNGAIKYVGNFKGDGYHGINCCIMNITGKPEFEGEMKEGNKVKGKQYFNNGNLYYEGIFLN